MDTRLNLILQGDDKIQCLITVMACTVIKWLLTIGVGTGGAKGAMAPTEY